MKAKKLYCYTTTIALGITMAALLVGMLITVILFPKDTWFLIIGIFLVLLMFWYMIGTGIFTPIYLYEKRIKYRGKEYDWENIRITAVSVPNRGYIESYYLVFGQEYLFGKDLKKQIRYGFWVYLKKKPLNEILKYYNKKIKILSDSENAWGSINSTKKINAIIQKHNDNIKD